MIKSFKASKRSRVGRPTAHNNKYTTWCVEILDVWNGKAFRRSRLQKKKKRNIQVGLNTANKSFFAALDRIKGMEFHGKGKEQKSKER